MGSTKSNLYTWVIDHFCHDNTTSSINLIKIECKIMYGGSILAAKNGL